MEFLKEKKDKEKKRKRKRNICSQVVVISGLTEHCIEGSCIRLLRYKRLFEMSGSSSSGARTKQPSDIVPVAHHHKDKLKKNYSLQSIIKNNILVEFTYDLFFHNQKSNSKDKGVYRKPSVWILKQDAISGNWIRSILFISLKAAAKYIFKNRGTKSSNNITYTSDITSIDTQIRNVCTRDLLEQEMTSENSKFDPIKNNQHKITWGHYSTKKLVCGYKCQYYNKSSDFDYLLSNKYVIQYNDDDDITATDIIIDTGDNDHYIASSSNSSSSNSSSHIYSSNENDNISIRIITASDIIMDTGTGSNDLLELNE